MAIYWLDLVRYADTMGYHSDNEQTKPPDREYVIDAFNENLPFDQFTAEQLAGDLLPDRTNEQMVASGFNRCHVTTDEGGAINDEALFHYAVERTTTLGTVFLGLTVNCAQCHDHRYDPIPQRDYYQLRAIFEPGLDPKRWRAPNSRRITLFTDADRKKSAEVEVEAKKLDAVRQKKVDFFIDRTLYIKVQLTRFVDRLQHRQWRDMLHRQRNASDLKMLLRTRRLPTPFQKNTQRVLIALWQHTGRNDLHLNEGNNRQ